MLRSRASSPTIAAAATFGAFALLIACSGRGTVPGTIPLQSADGKAHGLAGIRHGRPFTAYPIQHVFIIIQENRTFDNLFNVYPRANTAKQGLAITIGVS